MLTFYFDEDDLERLFERWASEGEDYDTKNRKFRIFMQRLEEEKEPFRAREEALREERRQRGENDELTEEDRIEIWRGFREISRRVEDEIYEKES